MLGHNLDFTPCDIMVGFRNSSHIYTVTDCFNTTFDCSFRVSRSFAN